MSFTPKNKRARIVLVGSGRMGQIRASLLYGNPRFDLCGVVDIDTAGASSLASKYSALPFSSLGEAIAHFGVAQNDPNCLSEAPVDVIESDVSSDDAIELPIDGIVISAPTFVHDSVIREAAKRKLAIFTEKPVDETSEKVQNLFDLCKREGNKLCCGFQRRFDDTYVNVADSVFSGRIGKAISANIFFGDHPCPPEKFLIGGGDIFMDLSAHDIDFIRWVLKDEVKSVYATGSSSSENLREAGVQDNATMVMTFTKGTVVTLTMSRSACYGYDQRCEIFGSEGLATVGNEFSNSSLLADSQGVHQSKLKHSFPQRFNQAFSSELDAFADTILLGTDWPVSPEDCIAVQKVADAAKESNKLNQVVHIES